MDQKDIEIENYVYIHILIMYYLKASQFIDTFILEIAATCIQPQNAFVSQRSIKKLAY